MTYTKWGRWKGLLELNTENGYVTCYNGDTKESGIFQTFVYDVMSDRFVETSNDPYRESFEKMMSMNMSSKRRHKGAAKIFSSAAPYVGSYGQ